MASHWAPNVAIELLFLGYLLFLTHASRDTIILATELLFFVSTASHCFTQVLLLVTGPPTTIKRRLLRITVGVVFPFSYTLAQIFGFLDQLSRHTEMGYSVENLAGVVVRLAGVLFGMCVSLLFHNMDL